MVALFDHGQGFYFPEQVHDGDVLDPRPQGPVHRLHQVRGGDADPEDEHRGDGQVQALRNDGGGKFST